MERLTQIVEAEGLVLLGVVPLDYGDDYERFEAWLAAGRHGGLEFLERHRDLRKDPGSLLDGARTVVLYALPYDQGDEWQGQGGPPRVAQYARFRDYHKVLWEKGGRIARGIREQIAPDGTFRVVADSAPVLERALAARSASGFIGKNTCFIDPKRGSLLLLGEILTTADLPTLTQAPQDSRIRTPDGGCGTCDLCQVHCPTGALHTDYSIDVGKCLAYWTIEHRGAVPEIYWPYFGQYWYGCDICQLVCPYNRKVRGRSLPAELATREIPPLDQIALMTQQEYEFWFGGSSMTRARREGLRRNALIALCVTDDPSLGRVLDIMDSDPDPVLRETAVTARLRKRVESPVRRPIELG